MKATYAVYDGEGRITAIVSGPTAAKLPPENAVKVTEDDGEITVSSHYVSNGIFTPYPERPSKAYEFNYTSGAWELDLSLAKSHKWDEIKTARSVEEFGTFDSLGYTFQSDEVSQRRLQGAVQLSQMDATLVMDWTLADNTVQSFTAAEYIQIGQDLAAHVNAVHIKSRQLRTQINAATTEAEVNAVTW